MKTFKDLTEIEKRVFRKIENIFLDTPLERKSYCRVLGVLLNKYKFK